MPETTGFVVQGRKPPNRENASAHFFALRANFYILRSRVALPMGPKPIYRTRQRNENEATTARPIRT